MPHLDSATVMDALREAVSDGYSRKVEFILTDERPTAWHPASTKKVLRKCMGIEPAVMYEQFLDGGITAHINEGEVVESYDAPEGALA